MRLVGPHRYNVTVQNGGGYTVLNSSGGNTFLAPITQRGPKLYVFASEGTLIYVGQTVQGMGARIRMGFQAHGAGGYYGYAWRNELRTAELLVWCLEDVQKEEELRALECIESEIVFTYRQQVAQWPRHQTEIHFHESTAEHRALAQQVFGLFPGHEEVART